MSKQNPKMLSLTTNLSVATCDEMTMMIKNLIASGAPWKFKYNKKNASNVVPLDSLKDLWEFQYHNPLIYQRIMGVTF